MNEYEESMKQIRGNCWDHIIINMLCVCFCWFMGVENIALSYTPHSVFGGWLNFYAAVIVFVVPLFNIYVIFTLIRTIVFNRRLVKQRRTGGEE